VSDGGVSEAAERRAALDEVLISELARGLPYEDAGRSVGWSGRTVARRMGDAGFRRRVSELRGEWVAQHAGRLVDYAGDAIEAIRDEVMTAERTADRLKAASLLLTACLRFRQNHELDERLRLIEDRLGLTTPDVVPGRSPNDAEGD
jgi:hypothetical protein